jgi:hypothetical protein
MPNINLSCPVSVPVNLGSATTAPQRVRVEHCTNLGANYLNWSDLNSTAVLPSSPFSVAVVGDFTDASVPLKDDLTNPDNQTSLSHELLISLMISGKTGSNIIPVDIESEDKGLGDNPEIGYQRVASALTSLKSRTEKGEILLDAVNLSIAADISPTLLVWAYKQQYYSNKQDVDNVYKEVATKLQDPQQRNSTSVLIRQNLETLIEKGKTDQETQKKLMDLTAPLFGPVGPTSVRTLSNQLLILNSIDELGSVQLPDGKKKRIPVYVGAGNDGKEAISLLSFSSNAITVGGTKENAPNVLDENSGSIMVQKKQPYTFATTPVFGANNQFTGYAVGQDTKTVIVPANYVPSKSKRSPSANPIAGTSFSTPTEIVTAIQTGELRMLQQNPVVRDVNESLKPKQ